MKVAYLLFSAPMVVALRAGRKTQTRRLAAPRWEAGDLICVREAFKLMAGLDGQRPSIMLPQTPIHYMADGPAPEGFGKGRPSIHMPRMASRITLRVVEVRQERLLDISEADAIAEGLQRIGSPSGGWWAVEGVEMARAWHDPRGAYIDLWDAINGEGASAANPLVYATTFEVFHGNIDRIFP